MSQKFHVGMKRMFSRDRAFISYTDESRISTTSTSHDDRSERLDFPEDADVDTKLKLKKREARLDRWTSGDMLLVAEFSELDRDNTTPEPAEVEL